MVCVEDLIGENHFNQSNFRICCCEYRICLYYHKLGYSKVCAEWVPRHLSEDRKSLRMGISLSNLQERKWRTLEHLQFTPDLSLFDLHVFVHQVHIYYKFTKICPSKIKRPAITFISVELGFVVSPALFFNENRFEK